MRRLCKYPVYLEHLGRYVGCGVCRACRVSKVADWTLRIQHQIATIGVNALFLTITYDEQHIPNGRTLAPREIQNWLKTARKMLERRMAPKFKYYICGEYGPQTSRPHYHAIIMGLPYHYKDVLYHAWRKCDKLQFKVEVVRSAKKAAGYVAGYVTKKLGRGYNAKFYREHGKEPEFQRCSIGLGKDYCLKHYAGKTHYYRNGKKCILPRYYRKILGVNPEVYRDEIIESQNKLVRYVQKMYPQEKLIYRECKNDGYSKGMSIYGDYHVSRQFWHIMTLFRNQCDLNLAEQEKRYQRTKQQKGLNYA